MGELNVWTSFEKFLPSEFSPYFLSATFLEQPIYHSKKRELDLHVQLDRVLPFEVYERVVQELQMKFQVTVNFYVQAKDSTLSMNEFNLYVERLVERESALRSFRFLHPFIENDTVCFATKDEERLTILNRALPTLIEKCEKLQTRRASIDDFNLTKETF